MQEMLTHLEMAKPAARIKPFVLQEAGMMTCEQKMNNREMWSALDRSQSVFYFVPQES